jgi:phosphoserine aminotransferase
MTKGGKLIEGIFVGETINTPSMLASRTISMRSTGRKGRRAQGLIARADANAKAICTASWRRDWIENLAKVDRRPGRTPRSA